MRAAGLKALLALLLAALPAAPQTVRFRVRETAGLRRFSYPVRATAAGRSIPLPARLLENGKAVPAQFTTLADGRIDIDFNASLGPWESREYQVQAGAGTPAADKGVTVERLNRTFAVRHGVEFDVPENLTGFLNEVRGGKVSYVRAGSAGLALKYRDGVEPHAVEATGEIVKRGPLVAGLGFESRDRGVKSSVRMDFPRSKSWVEVRWTVEDPQQRVSGLSADVNLLIEGPPGLVDLGANNTVYAALKSGQEIALESMPPAVDPRGWLVSLGGQPYAAGSKTRAEGWAHVMDQQRATAIAVAGFGEGARDRIQVSDTGRVLIRRDFLGTGDRSLHFWLHFVTMPVQVGAATSPQAMQNPLQVEWE
jgi:hypothetical protein